MEPVSAAVTWLASAAGEQIIGKLLTPPPGAGVADRSLKNWVAWRRHRKDLVERDIRALIRKLTLAAVNADPSLTFLGDEGNKVTELLVRTLMAIDVINMDLVQAARLDAERLAEELYTVAPDSAARLSPPARALFNKLLIGCSIAIIEWASRRPEFAVRTSVELTQAIEEIDQKITARLPNVRQREHQV